MKISRKYLVVSIKGLFFLFLLFAAYHFLTTSYQLPATTFAQSSVCDPGATPRADGLVTTPQLSGKFGTSARACITNSERAAFVSFKIPGFDDLKSIYYTQFNSSVIAERHPSLAGEKNQGDIPLTGNKDHIYHLSGNLTISGNIPGNRTGLVFVEGNLTINNNIGSGPVSKDTGLIFIVKGDVVIAPTVTRIDAVIVSSGYIYTAGSGCTTSSVDDSSQLTVNGSLISVNSFRSIRFCRKLQDNNITPSEIINHQAKYVVILKDLLSDSLQKWSEVTADSQLPIHQTSPAALPEVDIDVGSGDGPITLGHRGSAWLSWDANTAVTSCTASGAWSGTKPNPPSNQYTGQLNGPNTYTYTIACSNAAGSDSDSVVINVNPPVVPTADIKANDLDGPITIPHNASVNISWTSGNNPDFCTASGFDGAWTAGGNSGTYTTRALAGPNSYTFNLRCYNNLEGSNGSDSVVVNVSPPATTATRPTVTTKAANNITHNSATFNGTVNPNGGPTNARYRYSNYPGDCGGYWYNSQDVFLPPMVASNTPTDLPYTVQNLSPNTTYNFCISATNSAGSSYGSQLSFTTQPTPTPTPIPTPTPTPIIPGKRVFVTADTYSGGFLGGLAGADAKCQQNAGYANLGGSWKAWLSTSATSASSRMTHADIAYKLINGRIIANNWADLTDGRLLTSIHINQFGQSVLSGYANDPYSLVWTATSEYGHHLGSDCNLWNGALSSGAMGSILKTDYQWTRSVTSACFFSARLYCFEQ